MSKHYPSHTLLRTYMKKGVPFPLPETPARRGLLGEVQRGPKTLKELALLLRLSKSAVRNRAMELMAAGMLFLRGFRREPGKPGGVSFLLNATSPCPDFSTPPLRLKHFGTQQTQKVVFNALLGGPKTVEDLQQTLFRQGHHATIDAIRARVKNLERAGLLIPGGKVRTPHLPGTPATLWHISPMWRELEKKRRPPVDTPQHSG